MISRNSAKKELSQEYSIIISILSGSHIMNHAYIVLFPPILAILATDFNVGIPAIGIAMGAQAFVNTVLQLPYGYIADNYNRLLPLSLSLGLGASGTAILAVAPTYEILILGQLIVGAGVAGHHPAHFPLLSDGTPASIRGKIYSIHGFSGNLGFAAAPILITAIISIPRFTWRHAFALISFIGFIYTMIAFVVLFKYVDDSILSPNKKENKNMKIESSILKRGLNSIKNIANQKSILLLTIVVMFGSIAFWGVATYLAVFLTESYNVGSELANMSLSAMFVVGAVLIFIGGVLSDKFDPAKILFIGYFIAFLFIALFSLQVLPAVLAIAIGIFAGSIGRLGLPARNKLADRLSSDANTGRNFGILTMGILVGNGVAPPLFGFIIEEYNHSITFSIISLFAACAAIILIYIIHKW